METKQNQTLNPWHTWGGIVIPKDIWKYKQKCSRNGRYRTTSHKAAERFCRTHVTAVIIGSQLLMPYILCGEIRFQLIAKVNNHET